MGQELNPDLFLSLQKKIIMQFKWRKWNRAIHRDFGYFFAVITIIYALSGIALNHMDDWNPSYNVATTEIPIKDAVFKSDFDKTKAKEILSLVGEESNFKKIYFPPGKNQIKVFIKNGSLVIDLETNQAVLEKISRRPVFYQVNFLHYNKAGNIWNWVSDIFAGALIILAISGLFILKGKNGITRRGAVLTIAGLILPIVFILIYL